MDAAQALADLTEISSQVVHVVIVDHDGGVLASTIPDAARAERFAAKARSLFSDAEALVQARTGSGLMQIEASTPDGSVFAVRQSGKLIAATTRADPTVGLVFYDLKHCLASVEGHSAGTSGGKNAAA